MLTLRERAQPPLLALLGRFVSPDGARKRPPARPAYRLDPLPDGASPYACELHGVISRGTHLLDRLAVIVAKPRPHDPAWRSTFTWAQAEADALATRLDELCPPDHDTSCHANVAQAYHLLRTCLRGMETDSCGNTLGDVQVATHTVRTANTAALRHLMIERA